MQQPGTSFVGRVGASLLALGLGVWMAMLSLILHQRVWTFVLVLALTAAIMVWGFTTRTSMWLFVAGWVGIIGFAVFPRPEGDFLLMSDPPGYTLLGSGLILLFWALIASLIRPRRANPEPANPEPGNPENA